MSTLPHPTPGSASGPTTPWGHPKPRVLIALARERLWRGTGVRAAMLSVGLTTVLFAAIAVTLRVSDGVNVQLSGLVEHACRALALVAASAVGFAAARDREALDRVDGIETLVAMRGAPLGTLGPSRSAAAMLLIALAVGVPALGLTLFTVALAGSAMVALRQAALTVPVAIFAVACGVTIGFVAALCNRFGGRRGRWLLLLVLVGPWVVADLAGHAAWSIPGALDALLGFSIRLVSGGLRP